MFNQYEWGQTEVCPECEHENFYPNWDVRESNFIATCQECGKKIFLCDACLHSYDNPAQECNFHENENGRGCFRGWIKKGE